MAQMMSEIAAPKFQNRLMELLEAADHDVQVQVSHVPGETFMFSRPRSGMERSRTWWVIWPECEKALIAIEELDKKRQELGADWVRAVVMVDQLASGFGTDLTQRATVITFRRLAFELAEVADELRQLPSISPLQYLPRQGKMAEGSIVDPVSVLVDWVLHSNDPVFYVAEEEEDAFQEIFNQCRSRLKEHFRDHPNTPALIGAIRNPTSRKNKVRVILVREGWLVSTGRSIFEEQGRRILLGTPSALTICAADKDVYKAWFQANLHGSQRVMFDAAVRNVDGFLLLISSRHLSQQLLRAIEGVQPLENSEATWVAMVVIRFVEKLKIPAEVLSVFRIGALENYALGDSATLRAVNYNKAFPNYFDHLLAPDQPYPFRSPLLESYFLASHIAEEVHAGRHNLLLRYQFPDTALLFLTILAPEVAMRITADNSAALRQEIQERVEYEVEVTLAHQLNRSVGAIRSHVAQIREYVEQFGRDQMVREFERIEEELNFQKSLADKTQSWHRRPGADQEAIDVTLLLQDVVRPLKERFPKVQFRQEGNIMVMANRQGLSEVLANLVENAFHAVLAKNDGCVWIQLVPEGKTSKIAVYDNGPGIVEADQTRIFEPRVTTKKGGKGKPLGTGMGLPIARRYAEAMGGVVLLQPEGTNTCFIARFVTAYEVENADE